jgi:hypothetical protein
VKITVVGHPGGDWEGLFVDGKLLCEGHRLEWWQVLDALKVEYATLEADEEWMYDVGRFPERLKDVKLNTEGDK